MFRFENPDYLYLLILVPVLVLVRLYGLRKRKAQLKKFGDPKLLKALMPDVSRMRRELKFWLMMAAVVLLVVMLARPQMGTKISQEQRRGIEVLIALDISNSMKAEDVVPSRLDKSKMLIENLVDNFTNDKVGLVVFAGDAYTQIPITADFVSAKMFLSSINPSMVPTQGTAIGAAIKMAANSFTADDKLQKAIIVITDGENHEDDAVGAAKEAHDKGIQINVLGVGDQKGGPIPVGDGRYMKDDSGNMVITRPDEKMAKEIAEAGKGIYVSASNNDALNVLDARLKELSKSNIQKTVFSPNDEQFPVFAWIALVLLVIDIFVLDRKISWLKNINFFTK